MARAGTHWRASAVPIAWALILVLSANGFAVDTSRESSVYINTSWSERDGLPSSRIWSIAQDSVGYLWIGTATGLLRFDGVRFQLWDPPPEVAFPESAVRCVYRARCGSLWIGFSHGAVGRIRNGHLEQYAVLSRGTAGAVTFLLEDRSGTIWAGSRDGLYAFDGERWDRLGPSRGFAGGPAFGAYEDRRGNLWVGTNEGVIRRSAGESAFVMIDRSRTSVEGFVEDAEGRMWITDQVEGFVELGAPRGRRTGPPRSGNGSRLIHDRNGNLWVATFGQGLWCVRRIPGNAEDQRLTVQPITVEHGLSSDAVRSVFEDREGNIWAGTDAGLHRFGARKIASVGNIGCARVVEATADSSVWVGTASGLFRFLDGERQWYGPEDGLPGRKVQAICVDRGGALTLATNGGVARHVNGRFLPVPFPETAAFSKINGIGSDSRGQLWLSDFDDGIVMRSGGGWKRFELPPGVSEGKLTFLHVDRRDRVWMAFTGGRLVTVHPDGKPQVHHLRERLGWALLGVYEDSDGAVWVGGRLGVARVRDGRVDVVNQDNGMPGSGVFAIAEDMDGHLWLGLGAGIIRIARRNFEHAAATPAAQLRYELYNASDGLVGRPTWVGSKAAVRSSDGRVWFVTSAGVSVIDPGKMGSSQPAVSVHIERVTADDRQLDIAGSSRLPPAVSRLQVEYTALNLTSPEKVRFRYHLEGFDSDWVDARMRRDAVYTNLPHGRYRFHVIATSSEGTWSESSAVWDFSIRPMFYETPWFHAACAATLTASSLWVSWRLRVRRTRQEFALVLGERGRLSREIHDTLLQGMVGVALQFEGLSQSLDSSSPIARHLARLRRELDECIYEAGQSIRNLRSPTLERRTLAAALQAAGEHATAGRAVRFDLTVTGTPRACAAPTEQQILRIGQEALRNAARHAGATRILATLEYTPQSIVLRVVDDGRGFDLADASTAAEGHYGLVSMQERAAQVGGRLTIHTSPGAGTELTLAVPTPR